MKKSEKTQHGILSNVIYILKLMFSISPGLVIGEIVMQVVSQLPGRLVSVIGIKFIIDEAQSGGDTKKILIGLAVIVFVLVAESVARGLFSELYAFREYENLHLGIHRRLYDKAVSLDLASYDDASFYSDFILAIETSSENIRSILNVVKAYVSDIITFITIASIILTIDPICLVIVLVFVAAFIPVGKHTGNLQMQRREKITEKHRKSDYFARLFYLPDYAGEIRMNSLTPLLLRRFRQSADEIKETQKYYVKKIDFWFFVQSGVVQVIGFMLVLTAYIGYRTLVSHTMTAGDFVAAFNGAVQIGNSIMFLTVYAVRNFTERSKMIEKYRVFLASEKHIEDGAHVAVCGEPETIELKNVGFSYTGSEKRALENISMTIKPREKIALVGYNGAGKTTLTNLLLRLYDVSEGEILIGGRNIKEETVASHRDRFAAVFQDFKIFAGTVGENVALDKDYDKERVLKALEAAGFEKHLPNGTETILQREFDDEGMMLSGGESQKITIARAFYKNCPYVIFDEPSANLDPVSEYELNRSMSEAAKEKTVIFISHRLSTTRHADRIFMMEKGRIVESGTHEELMALDGKYAYMFKLQAEKYQTTIDN